MGDHYLEHQERVHVGTTFTSNMLLHAEKEGSLHSSQQTKKYNRQSTKGSVSRCSH